MARMIPPYITDQTSSSGERELFIRLRDDPITDNWIILHSFDIAHHRDQISGEVDFVIIIPEKGVLCVEVKACHSLRREDGLWFYGPDTRGDARGPFKQASTAMHSMRKTLVESHPELRNVLFWSAVIFPYIQFSDPAIEWHPWQVIDRRHFLRSVSKALIRVADQARIFLQTHPRTAAWYQGQSTNPTPLQCTEIAAALRPHFEFFESPHSRRSRLEGDLKRYTNEQLTALDAMESNPRVIFAGPAGTGKTVLAIESVRRSVAEGRRVLLVCFNRWLGQHLARQVQELGSQVVCMTIHRYMLQIAGLQAQPHTPGFWQETLPDAAIETLLDGGGIIFDELIIDEGQDILRNSYLDVLDLSLQGGLAAGRWRMFGDFEKQAIYHSADIDFNEFVTERAAGIPIYRLRTNCRNTPRIVEHVHLLSGLSPKYSRTLRPDEQLEPEIHYYHNTDEQTNIFITTLERLYREGFSGQDIIVLSPVSGEHSLAHQIQHQPWKDRLRPFSESLGGYIPHTSIAAFKGMEASVVIVTDIETILGKHASSLLYIASTRALHHLILLMDSKTKTEIQQLLALR